MFQKKSGSIAADLMVMVWFFKYGHFDDRDIIERIDATAQWSRHLSAIYLDGTSLDAIPVKDHLCDLIMI